MSLYKDNESLTINKVAIEALEQEHEEIYKTIPNVLNTGFFIANKLFYPGDALINPKREIEVLALPVAGPWIKIGEAIDYALKLKPNHSFPVHDGMLKIIEPAHRIPSNVLPKNNIDFEVIEVGESKEY